MNEIDIMLAQERQRDLQREVERWESLREAGFTPHQPWWRRLFSFGVRDKQNQPTHSLQPSSDSCHSLLND